MGILFSCGGRSTAISKANNSIMNELEAVAANTLSFLRIKLIYYKYFTINFRSLTYQHPNQLWAQLLWNGRNANQFRPKEANIFCWFVCLFVMLRKQFLLGMDLNAPVHSLSTLHQHAGDCGELEARGWAMIRGLARFAFNWPFHVGFAMIQVFSYFYSHANSCAGSSSSDEWVPTDN